MYYIAHSCSQVTVPGSSGGLVAYADSGSDAAVEQPQLPPRKKVVVLGTGWGGTTFLRNLDSRLYDVQVISPRNYFAFTPLLPSVTSGTVEPRSIVEPIRRVLEKVCCSAEFIAGSFSLLIGSSIYVIPCLSHSYFKRAIGHFKTIRLDAVLLP